MWCILLFRRRKKKSRKCMKITKSSKKNSQLWSMLLSYRFKKKSCALLFLLNCKTKYSVIKQSFDRIFNLLLQRKVWKTEWICRGTTSQGNSFNATRRCQRKFYLKVPTDAFYFYLIINHTCNFRHWSSGILGKEVEKWSGG